MLVESGGFMDSLFASTTAVKKEPKKRKRLTSNSKKDDESPKIATAPLKFYKDTLDEDESKDDTKEESDVKDDVKDESKDDESMNVDKELKSDGKASSPKSEDVKEEEEEEVEEKRPPGPGCGPDGPPGVLTDVHKKRKRPKKLLKWRPQEELEEVRYFELDENERANVTKTFIEQKQMERCDESRNFALGRKLQGEDTMVEQTQWRTLFIVDNVPDHMYGSKSRECKIQSDREKTVLMDIYLDRHSLIDSPHEPDVEHYEFLEPQIIPLEDLTGNPDAVNAFTDIPWPEPKGDSSHPTYLSDAFANIFPNMNNPHPQFIPPFLDQSKGFNPLGVNPLANFQMGAMGLDTNPQMLNKWILPPAFLPPPLMNQNFQINRGVGMPNQMNNNGNNNNSNNNNNNNFQRNRGNDRNDRNDRNGGNWVRGNANNNGNGRWRGSCKQYAQKGYCSNGDRCIYSHSPKY